MKQPLDLCHRVLFSFPVHSELYHFLCDESDLGNDRLVYLLQALRDEGIRTVPEYQQMTLATAKTVAKRAECYLFN